jgi:hypothetical protein
MVPGHILGDCGDVGRDLVDGVEWWNTNEVNDGDQSLRILFIGGILRIFTKVI